MKYLLNLLLLLFFTSSYAASECSVRGTGDLGVIIQRANSSVLVVDTSKHETIFKVDGVGDLSHASIVFSRDARYAYVFARDGGLSKIDILRLRENIRDFTYKFEQFKTMPRLRLGGFKK